MSEKKCQEEGCGKKAEHLIIVNVRAHLCNDHKAEWDDDPNRLNMLVHDSVEEQEIK